ncbi:uncharacterized protein GV1 isoform X2 [Bactrocera oleae]|uniref:uncharacterized protein GV1 isoform X2 n=1 Tax=Bactrocera oleae TaxID=104688 RepID=UPI00387EA1A0
MFTQPTYVLVTCLISICSAIRVDFNTNKGPIVPPTPRTTIRPLPPFREPAPVWEDQSNDIPNPNPYTYILPPPSRPRTTDNIVGNAGQRPLHYYGNLLLPSNENAFTQQGSTNVGGGSLAAKYIPNIGIRYTAVVAPAYNSNSNNNNNYNNNQANRNNGGGNYFDVNNKLHGKYYNAKTKKYKAYEKVKYVPQNYYLRSELALPIEKPYTNAFNQEQLIRTQQLPQIVAPNAFRPVEKVATEVESQLHSAASTPQNTVSAAATTPITANTAATQAKWAHEKDQPLLKGKSLLESNKAQAQLPITSTTTTTNRTGGQQANAISSAKSR